MKKIIIILVFAGIDFLFAASTVFAQLSVTINKDTVKQKSMIKQFVRSPAGRIGIAMSEGLVFNIGLNRFDLFVLDREYARVTKSSIQYNLTHKSAWDNEMLFTNMIAHPYAGGLYFNAARANGFNFWQSIPFAVAGSYVWEYFGENIRASLNDLIATPIGGIALGEMTHRLSYLVLDDRQRGWKGLGNELLAGIISPMDFLNRMLNCDGWRFSPRVYNGEYHYPHQAFLVDFSVYNRFLTHLTDHKSDENMGVKCSVIYGEAFALQNYNPYDFFTFDINFTVLGKQPILSEVNLVGILWGKGWDKAENSWLAGIFQHFDYYESNPIIKDGSRLYEFAETVSFGGGLLYKNQREENRSPRFCGNVYANLILLGASELNYTQDSYNHGYGYSIKLDGLFHFEKRWDASFGFKRHHLFAYEDPADSRKKGNTYRNMVNLNIDFQLSHKIKISAEQRFHFRNAHFDYLEDIETSLMENRLKLTYTLSDTYNHNK
ncbi:hypothetical protein EZS27_011766 [termite gut metagenome]|uniref:DUF3943 domain-containing protein n=1 Tax=termite gut metagenome TaxID=433724 RepID=A0A5J4S4W6_9ZZZZ